jgi:putative aldouronate transport system substrate-binding protein
MKKGLKVFSAITVIVSMALTAACSQNKSDNTSNSNTDKPLQTATNNATSTPPETKNAKKQKISMMSFTYGNPPAKDGKGLQALNEKLNIDYDATIVPYANYQEKLATTVAGGGLADLTVIEEYLAGANLYKWAKQGAFLTLNDYIDKYPSLKLVPKDIWNSVTVDGKIFAIPNYYPQLPEFDFIIRKDWLDNLNLQVPTSYEELKKVAIAFTKDDPDKNTKNDTYGMAMSEYGHPYYANGAYWDATAWYHKDSQGNLIPGVIGPGRKEYVQFVSDLYKQGAVTKDFGAIKNFADVQKDFYSGKAGIYVGGMRGLNAKNAEALLTIDPKATFVGIPPFKAPDGSQGKTVQKGFYTVTVLNAKLKDDTDKIDRILQLNEMGREFFPIDQRNPQNAKLDFLWGGLNEGYTMTDTGSVKLAPAEQGKSPANYLPYPSQWAPSVLDNGYSKTQTVKQYTDYVLDLEKIFKSYKGYVNPINFAASDSYLTKGDELMYWALGEQVKMMMGRESIDNWDKMVQTYMEKGGAQIIKEVNESLKGKDLSNLFKDMK